MPNGPKKNEMIIKKQNLEAQEVAAMSEKEAILSSQRKSMELNKQIVQNKEDMERNQARITEAKNQQESIKEQMKKYPVGSKEYEDLNVSLETMKSLEEEVIQEQRQLSTAINKISKESEDETLKIAREVERLKKEGASNGSLNTHLSEGIATDKKTTGVADAGATDIPESIETSTGVQGTTEKPGAKGTANVGNSNSQNDAISSSGVPNGGAKVISSSSSSGVIPNEKTDIGVDMIGTA